jgi:hypothetical protein
MKRLILSMLILTAGAARARAQAAPSQREIEKAESAMFNIPTVARMYAHEITEIPIEFAVAVLSIKYSPDEANDRDANRPVGQMLAARRAYWEKQSAVLLQVAAMERQRASEAADQGRLDSAMAYTLSSVQLSRFADAAAMLVEDVKLDQAYVAAAPAGREAAQKLLDRKAALFNKLGALH